MYVKMISVVLVFLFGLTSFALTDAELNSEIEKLRTRLSHMQAPDGKIPLKKGQLINTHPQGATLLNMLALNYAGMKAADPVMKRSLKYILENPPGDDVYSSGLYLMVLQQLDARRYKSQIQEKANWLLKTQAADGTWNYTGTGAGDNSVTQFALLGLKAAREAGMELPRENLERSRKHFLDTQNADGGWGYKQGNRSTPSMTTAALTSLEICGEDLNISLELTQGPSAIGRYKSNPQIQQGMNLLGSLLKQAPATLFSSGYTAYGLERVGIFFDRRYINGVDWYRLGADTMIRSKYAQVIRFGYAFPLLFLAKGNTPLLMGKILPEQDEINANLRRNDCRNIVGDLKLLLESPVDWEQVELSQENKSLGKLSLLYWSGKTEPSLNEDERAVLATYLREGGTLLLAPCQQNPAFLRGAQRELNRLYPGSSFDPLSREHDLRHMFYDLRDVSLPLKVLNSECDERRIFVLSEDLSLAYEAKKPSKLQRLMMANLARFALREKPLLGRLLAKKLIVKKEVKAEGRAEALLKLAGADATGIQLAYLNYSGNKDQKKRNSGLTIMQAYFRQAFQMSTRQESGEADLAKREDLLQFPFLLMNGNEELKLSELEKKNLKYYLENGGFIYAENSCSSKKFVASLELLINELFSDIEMETVVEDHLIYQEPYNQELSFQSEAPETFLRGLRLGQRYVLLTSPIDISSSLKRSAKGLEEKSAYRIFSNIINYALSY